MGQQVNRAPLPEAEYQGAPQDVVEMTFTCFLTPWEVTFLETARIWKVAETTEDGAQWLMTVGPHYQSHRLSPLDIVGITYEDNRERVDYISTHHFRARSYT